MVDQPSVGATPEPRHVQRLGDDVDADIRSFFDGLSQEWLVRFLAHRIGDERVIRLVRKWLKAGVLENGQWSVSETGTPQGAVVSPLLANVYLHYVFDLWAQQWRRREATGNVIVVRYADDIVAGFEHEADARRFWDAMRRGSRNSGSSFTRRRRACWSSVATQRSGASGVDWASLRPSTSWGSRSSVVGHGAEPSCSTERQGPTA